MSSVGGTLYVVGNGALLSLDGLQGLSSIHGSAYIVDNDALTSLREQGVV